MAASYTQCLRLTGYVHEEKAVVLAIEIGDRDGLEGQSVQTADSVHPRREGTEKNNVINRLNHQQRILCDDT